MRWVAQGGVWVSFLLLFSSLSLSLSIAVVFFYDFWPLYSSCGHRSDTTPRYASHLRKVRMT